MRDKIQKVVPWIAYTMVLLATAFAIFLWFEDGTNILDRLGREQQSLKLTFEDKHHKGRELEQHRDQVKQLHELAEGWLSPISSLEHTTQKIAELAQSREVSLQGLELGGVEASEFFNLHPITVSLRGELPAMQSLLVDIVEVPIWLQLREMAIAKNDELIDMELTLELMVYTEYE